MSKLLKRAKVKFENAITNYKHIREDDAYLDDCCYNLQQAIEMSLKYIVEMNGERYILNHDVRAQLNVLDKIGAAIPHEEELRNMAVTLNDWEASSRYLDSFYATVKDVEQAQAIAKSLIEYADSLATEELEEEPLEETKSDNVSNSVDFSSDINKLDIDLNDNQD